MFCNIQLLNLAVHVLKGTEFQMEAEVWGDHRARKAGVSDDWNVGK